MADGRLAIFAAAVTLISALSPAVAGGEENAAEVEEYAAEAESAGLTSQAFGDLAPPFLEGLDGIVTKGGNWSIDPANWTRTAAIKVRGSVGGETEARVKVRVEGKGTPAFVYPSQQTVIAIQDSGAMATNDPTKERVDGAATYIDQMRNASQVSVIRFPRDNNNAPVLLIGLTANYSAAKNVLNPATFNNTGSTPLRDALHMANNVLATNRLPGFTQNIVLVSNGCATIGGSAWPEVNRSKNESIRVFTVGLYEGNGSTQKQQCEATMRSWANATGGTYLWMRNATEMVQVHTEVERLLTDIAGSPPGGGSAMVSVKMTDNIEVVPGSWVCDPGKCADPAPDNASGIQNGNRGIFINWSAPATSLRVGEVWQVEFGVHSYTLGTGVKVNDAAVSRVRYTGHDGSVGKVDKIEQLLVDVTAVCPGVCVSRVDLSPGAWSMKIGETKQFGAVAYDQNNNTISGAQWNWSSTGSIGTVNSTGLFTAAAAGGGQVVARATYNGTNGSGAADVTVTDPSAGAPYVASTTPAANAVDVFPGTSITIYWNESMDTASAEGATSISPTVTCAWSWATPVQQKCVPTLPLASFVKHDVTVSTSAKDATGVAMKSPFTFSFTTGGPGPAPTAMQSNPTDGALRVPRATPIQVMFSAPMDTASTESALFISPAASGAFSWSGGDTTITLTPSPILLEATRYTVTIGTGAKSYTGVPIAAPFTFSFTTQPSPLSPPNVIQTSPVEGATNVDPSITVSLWFDQVMDPGQTQAALATMPPIAGAHTWSSAIDRLDIKSTLPLVSGAKYTLTLSSQAASSNGVRMAQEFRLTFTVVGAPDNTPPKIVHEPIFDSTEGKPALIKAQITDASGLLSKTVYYRKSGETAWNALNMSKETAISFIATVPGANVTPPSFEYYIEAWDTQSNSATAPANGSAGPYIVSVPSSQPPGPDPLKAVAALGPVGIAALIAAAGIAIAMGFLLMWKRKKGKKEAAGPPPSFFDGLGGKAAVPVIGAPPVFGVAKEPEPKEDLESAEAPPPPDDVPDQKRGADPPEQKEGEGEEQEPPVPNPPLENLRE